jgi:hypothetical protein
LEDFNLLMAHRLNHWRFAIMGISLVSIILTLVMAGDFFLPNVLIRYRDDCLILAPKDLDKPHFRDQLMGA